MKIAREELIDVIKEEIEKMSISEQEFISEISLNKMIDSLRGKLKDSDIAKALRKGLRDYDQQLRQKAGLPLDDTGELDTIALGLDPADPTKPPFPPGIKTARELIKKYPYKSKEREDYRNWYKTYGPGSKRKKAKSDLGKILDEPSQKTAKKPAAKATEKDTKKVTGRLPGGKIPKLSPRKAKKVKDLGLPIATGKGLSTNKDAMAALNQPDRTAPKKPRKTKRIPNVPRPQRKSKEELDAIVKSFDAKPVDDSAYYTRYRGKKNLTKEQIENIVKEEIEKALNKQETE